MNKQVINKQEIAKSFGKAAHSYDSSAHFQRWVGERLLDKFVGEHVHTIVDLGCGTGYFAATLKERHPDALYVGLDLSEDMLRFASTQVSGASWLAGDAESLPFADNSVDLIYSSLAIQWCSDLSVLFNEIQRVLAPNGCFMFSTLLDGSLFELKASWADVDQIEAHVNEFAFCSDYQTAIQQTGLETICLDQETKVLEYQTVRELTRELKQIGAHNIREERPKHLTGKARLKAFVNAYERFRRDDGVLPATYQVLFGVLKKNAF